MKNLPILLLVCYSLFPTPSGAQPYSVQDSIKIFYDSLFSQMERQYVASKKVGWSSLKSFIVTDALTSPSLEDALSKCTLLLESSWHSQPVIWQIGRVYILLA